MALFQDNISTKLEDSLLVCLPEFRDFWMQIAWCNNSNMLCFGEHGVTGDITATKQPF